jgi:hypothetical protein
MKKILLPSIALVSILSFNACKKCECTCPTPTGTKDTTITLQPDAANGKDALVFGTQGCSAGAQFENVANSNFANLQDFSTVAWTFNANGCSTGQYRNLIEFTGLNAIPANATIVSAKLSLYGVSSSLASPQGNSTYPGSPYTSFGTNESLLQRVTAPWGESTVTWNNQPATSTVNQVILPASTTQWNYNALDIDVTNMVKDMLVPANGNHGFLSKIQNEQYYRCINFASSDHPNGALRPKLVVNYKY